MPLIVGQLTQTGDLLGTPIASQVLMSRTTGTRIYDADHIVQGWIDILTTPIGARVMRRDYGSDLFKLIDQPVNRYIIAKIYAAIIIPLNRWEIRARVREVNALNLTELSEGKITFGIEGYYRAEQRALSVKEISLDFYGENSYELNLFNSSPA